MRAIAEPRRREILRLVQTRELSAGEIALHFDVTRPAISQHLGVLTTAGLVCMRRDGTRRLYRARPEGLAELKSFLEEFWDDRLQLLAREAESRRKEAKMTTSSESGVVEREIRIAARPETVFSFFIDPEKMTRWKGIGVTLEPHPGGTYRVDMNGNNIARGEYLEVVPNSRVVFSWGWEGEGSALPPGSSRVEVTLTPDNEGTIVLLRHLGLPADQQDAHAEGWEHYMARLAIAGAGGDPGPDPWAAAGQSRPRLALPLGCGSPVRLGRRPPARWIADVATIKPSTEGLSARRIEIRRKKMAKFMDYHASLPPMPPEAMQEMKARVEGRQADQFGSKALTIYMGTGGQAYCLSEAPDADAVIKSHQAKGVPLGRSEIVEVTSLA